MEQFFAELCVTGVSFALMVLASVLMLAIYACNRLPERVRFALCVILLLVVGFFIKFVLKPPYLAS